MANSFARSTRSLQNSNFYRSLVSLVVVVLLLVVWLAWFFFAQVTLYEISEPGQIALSEVVEFDFPSQAQGRLQRGQMAFLKLDGHIGTEVGPIPAMVLEVDNRPEVGQVHTTMLVLWPLVPDVPNQDKLTGQVEVEVEHLSPARLVMRAINDGLRMPTIKFTPQQRLSSIKPISWVLPDNPCGPQDIVGEHEKKSGKKGIAFKIKEKALKEMVKIK
ncbi:MAG: hypothetical protein KDI79_11885 [Anaerolineae bacterium]|nr:hypothetical protein [Anaerolineae bacterium]